MSRASSLNEAWCAIGKDFPADIIRGAARVVRAPKTIAATAQQYYLTISIVRDRSLNWVGNYSIERLCQ